MSESGSVKAEVEPATAAEEREGGQLVPRDCGHQSRRVESRAALDGGPLFALQRS
ncbi:MAG: hypothetical protein ACRDL0_14630 [Thermoleophilaceae bacterium]